MPHRRDAAPRYVVLIDGSEGAYGVVVPDLPGCTAMGATIDEALTAALDAMRDWADVVEETAGEVPAPRAAETVRTDPEVGEALAEGAMLASIALLRPSGHQIKANLSLDAGVLAVLDAEARRNGLTRSAMVEAMTRRLAAGTL